MEALDEAIEKYGAPEIFNTDQGSQFTSLDFTGVLKDHRIKISMDSKGRWMDNVMIERLWRSMKHECIYLKVLTDGLHARKEIANWIRYYNEDRPHSTFNGQTPSEI